MTNEEVFALLREVQQACQMHPDLVGDVVNAANQGVRARLAEMTNLTADIEALALLAMARRSKSMDGAVLAKLKKINGKSFVNWDSNIAELESKG